MGLAVGRSAKEKNLRQSRIIAELQNNPSIRISEMAREFGVSGETIRRDVEELNRSGKVARTYGGAVARPFGAELAWDQRHVQLRKERAYIAGLAMAQVSSGDILMIDAGSTVLHFAQHLARGAAELTVITNGLHVATALGANPAIKVVVCPGTYDSRQGCVLGVETVEFIARFNATSAFVGASGISARGPNDANSALVAVKRAMFAQSQQRILLADHGKFDRAGMAIICPLERLTMLISDKAPEGELALALNGAGVKLLS
jgi:DeoR/GlpR family transcriptional regulator of sugar metabolism